MFGGNDSQFCVCVSRAPTFFFFFNDTATTEIYTLSLHDALPICSANAVRGVPFFCSSLAFATENKLSSITDGVITNLVNGEMYWASKNKGSFFNEERIKVHNSDPIYKIVGINISGATVDLMKRLHQIGRAHV